MGILQLPAVRRDPLPGHGLPGTHHRSLVGNVIFSGKSHADMGHRRNVGFADGPPPRHARRDATVEEEPVHFHEVIACAGRADEQIVQPDGHHGPDFLDRIIRTISQGMAVDDPSVFLFDLIFQDALILVPAHAAVESVDGLALMR